MPARKGRLTTQCSPPSKRRSRKGRARATSAETPPRAMWVRRLPRVSNRFDKEPRMTRTFELSELIRTDNFIGGRWVPAADGARFAVTDPATDELIAQVADSGAADARAATD